jgi:hypothetical protein
VRSFSKGVIPDVKLLLLGVLGPRLSAWLLTQNDLTVENCCNSEMALRATIMTLASGLVL